MIKPINSVFLGLIAALISSCGQLNYGSPSFVSTESTDYDLLIDSLETKSYSDFDRLYNNVYETGYGSINTPQLDDDSTVYLDVVQSEIDSSELVLDSNAKSVGVSEQKGPQTIIYAETVNIYQSGNKNDSIVIIKYNELRKDSLGNAGKSVLEVPSQQITSAIIVVDSIVAVPDSVGQKAIEISGQTKLNPNLDDLPKIDAAKLPDSLIQGQITPAVKTDTIFNQVYITDTIRSVVPNNSGIPVPVVAGTNRVDTVFSNQVDTVYLTDQNKQDSLAAVINKLKNNSVLPVSDTSYVIHINQDPIERVKIDSQPNKTTDTVYIKEIETVYQTITDTITVQEIKEVASKPIIIEKKPIIKEFIITFEKNTSKGDNFEAQSKSILEICARSNDYLILLAGHTDKSGSEGANIIMSQKRATSIRDQLIAKGIDKTKIVTQWFGEEYATQENSAAERIVKVRIEIRD